MISSPASNASASKLPTQATRWSDIMTLLDPVKSDSFLGAFWASRHGNMEGTKLFKGFKVEYDDTDKLYQVGIDMRGAAERYGAIYNPSDSIWSSYSDKAKRSVEALLSVGSSQMHPMILAAIERFEKKEMERLLWLLEVIAVRFQVIDRGRPGRIESLGSRAAKDIYDKQISTATQVRAALDELYVPDSTFKEGFVSHSETDGKKTRYLLSVLERQSILREGKHLHNELRPDIITLEHIFPKSPGNEWANEIAREPSLHEYLYRLGNTCLLPEVNRALGNKSFREKSATYGSSRLNTTRSLGTTTEWNRSAIETRQKHLSELAVAAWRFQ